MLKLTGIDILLRTIPEAFLFVLSAYLFSFKKINKKDFSISVLLLSICTYLVRELPIHYGVHIIINIAVFGLIMVFIDKIDLAKAMTYSFGVMMILSICEWLNLFVLDILAKNSVQYILKDPIIKNLCFLPSLVLFLIIVLLIRFLIKERVDCV